MISEPLRAARFFGTGCKWLALGSACAVFAVACLGGDRWRLALRYERAALADGEWWRIVTAHLVHLGWVHAALNLVGLALCLSLATQAGHSRGERTLGSVATGPSASASAGLDSVWSALGVLILLMAGVSGGLWIFSPGIVHYVGFSGVLYGLLVLVLWPQRRDPWMAGALALVLAWMAWQQIAGPMASEERMIGGAIVGAAHVYGVATALAWLAVLALWRRLGRR